MTGWLESLVGPDYAAALMWTIVGLIALLVLLILIRIVRGFGVGTFISGGRNRKARLAVMDATAVDSHRRLVLVRRDDVEHLILIGGPTDVVVEQNIRQATATRRIVEEDDKPRRQAVPDMAVEQPRVQHQQTQPQIQPTPAPRPMPAAPPRPAATIPVPVSTSATAAPVAAPSVQMEPRAPQTPPQAAPVYAPPVPAPQITPVQTTPASQPAPTAPVPVKSEPDKTLDEEMSRLLNDLAGQR